MNPRTRETALQLLREEFQREWAADFPLLRQIPATAVRKFLDYFANLHRSQRNDLAEALAQSALSSAFPSEPHPDPAGHPAYGRYLDAMPLMWDWKYEGVRELRMRLAVAELQPRSPVALPLTPELKSCIQSIQPVKSTEIRKTVKLALSQILHSMKTTHQGRQWLYAGDLDGRAISVAMDFSHKSYQLEYTVCLAGRKTRKHPRGFSYEQLMGLSSPRWDCLHEANLDQSAALLKHLVTRCADIAHRLPS